MKKNTIKWASRFKEDGQSSSLHDQTTQHIREILGRENHSLIQNGPTWKNVSTRTLSNSPEDFHNTHLGTQHILQKRGGQESSI